MEQLTPSIGLLAGSLLQLVPIIIVVWACFALYSRTKSTPATLMLVGAGLDAVLLLANLVVTHFMFSLTSDGYGQVSLIFGVLSFFGLVGGLLFGVGLHMQVNRWLADQEEKKDEF
jgi:hypothetical protein